MDLREQIYVLSIARHGGIKKAAEELHISPPTLSIFLSSLENRIGLPLFDRLGRRFAPTEAGALYIRTAQEMVKLKEDYENQLSDLKNEQGGSMQIGIHPRRTLYLLAGAMKQFVELYPDIQLITHEESSEAMFSMLLTGELDFIISNNTHPDPSLVFSPFYQDHLVLVTRADHPLGAASVLLPGEDAPRIDLNLFREETFILPSSSQSSRQFADKAFAACGFSPRKSHIIENLEAGAQMAAEGLGVSFNLESYILNFHYPKPIRYYYITAEEQPIQYYIVCRRDKYMPAHTQRFISILKESSICQKPPRYSGSFHRAALAFDPAAKKSPKD